MTTRQTSLMVLAILQVSSCYKLEDYCRVECGGGPNIVCAGCKTSPICKYPKKHFEVEQEVKDILLEEHNLMREKLAVGELLGGGRMEAANMHVLSYSDELEFTAACMSMSCLQFKMDEYCIKTPKFQSVGVNIYRGGGSPYNPISAWIRQDSTLSVSMRRNFSKGESYSMEYTQMVWAKTRYVGCQFNVDKWEMYIWICLYHPMGNVDGDSVYLEGKACSSCNGSEVCGRKYHFLCGEIDLAINNDFVPPMTLGTGNPGRKAFLIVLVVFKLIFY